MTSSSARSGLLYALCGFALLSIGDAVIKSIAGAWPGTAVAALRYSIGAIGLGALLLLKEGRQGFCYAHAQIAAVTGIFGGHGDHLFFLVDFPHAIGRRNGHRLYQPHDNSDF